MKQQLTIAIKNIVRQAVYKIYRLYKNHLEYKIHIYDLQTIDVINDLPVDAVCVDIGVNEGQILHHLQKRCKKGLIICIEPIAELASYIKSRYNRKNIEVRQLALSDEDTQATFYYFPGRNAISGLRPRDLDQTNTSNQRQVEVRKLDNIFKEDRLDFIKIDVEGAEYNVLNGAKNMLNRFHPLIIFESGKGGMEYFNHTPEELYHLLSSMGYKLSTLNNYLNKNEAFSQEEFLSNYRKGYDFEYIAFV
ncbi:MAG: hypothetical protein NVSMB67_10560 [Flavisolibacter sp.]